MENIKHIIESLLFVAEDPLTIEKLRAIMETVDAKEIREALQTLSEEYDERGGGFFAERSGRRLANTPPRPEYHEWIKRMLQPSPQRLSKAALGNPGDHRLQAADHSWSGHRIHPGGGLWRCIAATHGAQN